MGIVTLSGSLIRLRFSIWDIARNGREVGWVQGRAENERGGWIYSPFSRHRRLPRHLLNELAPRVRTHVRTKGTGYSSFACERARVRPNPRHHRLQCSKQKKNKDITNDTEETSRRFRISAVECPPRPYGLLRLSEYQTGEIEKEELVEIAEATNGDHTR